MNGIGEIMITAVVFAGSYKIIELFVKRKERLILIEKGMNSIELKSDFFDFSGLKFGLFFVGIGLGIFIANVLETLTNLEPEFAYFSMIFLFGGLALIIHHLIEKKSKS